MKQTGLFAVMLLAAVAVQAEPRQQPREIIVIPKSYVSPGASGSIGGYQQYEQRRLINGRAVPDLHRHERIESGNYQLQQRGGIRQSIEYPGGLRIQQSPGSGGVERRQH